MTIRAHRLRAATTAAIACAAVGLSLVACDDGADPDPTQTTDLPTSATTAAPTPTTESPTQSYQEQQIDDAERFVQQFYATVGEVSNDGYENWSERLFPFYAGDLELWENDVAPLYEALEAAGGSTEGATQIHTVTATDWTPDPTDSGFDTVAFDLCVDPRSVVYLDANGDVDPDNRAPEHMFPVQISVMGQPDSEFGWSITDFASDAEATCGT